MSGSKNGSQNGSQSGSKRGPQGDAQGKGSESHEDIAARISASIGAAASARPASDASPAVRELKKPRPVTVANQHARSLMRSASGEDDLADDLLPQPLDGTELDDTGERPDLFLPIVGIFALLVLAGSFISFLLLGQVATRDVGRPNRPSPSPSLQSDLSGQGVYIVEYGGMPTPSPSLEPTPSPSGVPAQGPSANDLVGMPMSEESLAPPPLLPAATLAPPARNVLTPPPLKPRAVIPSKPPSAKPSADNTPAAYQVLAGPFDSHSEAEGSSSELADLGKAVKIQEDKGKFWLLLGDPASSQEDALALAEQVVQRGKQVIVKKK